MSSSALEPAADQLVDLGPRGEEEWQRLRYQIENADAFWLGFVFTPDPRVARQLRRRTESLLRARARALRVLRPSAPEDLQLGLVQLFDEESSRVGFVWLEALQVDPPGASERGPWMAAWDRLLLRLNERRDRLRRNLRGGAVLAASPAVKRRIQRAAPDLWSIRTVVAEVPVSRREGPLPKRPAAFKYPIREASQGLAAADTVAQNPVIYDGDARELLRRAEGKLLLGEHRDAIRLASEAVATRDRGAPDGAGAVLLARALATQAEAEAADGDTAAAIEHFRRAVDVAAAEPPGRDTLLVFGKWYELSAETGHLADAWRAAEGATDLARNLVESQGKSPQSLRDLSVSLDNLGNVLRESGELSSARVSYEESLELRRRLLSSYGESPQSLRDLHFSLDRVGDLEQDDGNARRAVEMQEGAAGTGRRRIELYGETPQTLRELKISLEKVASIRAKLDDPAGAAEARDHASRLEERLAEIRQGIEPTE